ncbi:Annexin 2 [Spironucleus salmonicida]|uniref:Annexin 2 n=1 Tax=Spironucleus salmonicida TaxID=348837 RepID=V6LCM6_9EUKA|nr:Annexin 2 [Spironucleus salmonicida]|eukprot:EST42008.1 Annexin 2 [Spironucleus salmonicida]
MSKTNADFVRLAEQIQVACKGAGTDEAKIIDVICQCTPDELFEVTKAFYCCYGKDLSTVIKKETSGKLEDLLLACFEPRYKFWATQLKKAIKGMGTDERTLAELIFMADENDMKEISNAYFRLFKAQMVEDVADDLSKNPFSRLIKAWMCQTRFDRNQAQQDATTMTQAIKGAGTDEQAVIRMLCTSTSKEYAQIAQIYEQNNKKSLRDAIKGDFAGKAEYAFLLAHDFLIAGAQACAFILHKSMKGAGTKEVNMINAAALFRDRYRSVVNEYYPKFSGSLAKDIKSDFSGNMEKSLLLIWDAK